MRKSIKTMLSGLVMVPALVLGLSLVTPVVSQVSAQSSTVDEGAQAGADAAKGTGQKDNLFGEDGMFRIITNTALFIIGAVSVLMLVYGGIRYTISMGDPKNVEAAKNTILYAIVGIVVALLAYAIVNFVLSQLING